jgi:phosphate transport system substrate-binding protein
MKKTIVLVAFAAILLLSLGGYASAAGQTGNITVISREDGSGTRGAFIELFGVLESGTDNTAATAEITNSTAVMMTSIAGDASAIGYISLGSLNDTVKALNIDGAAATTGNINNGSYKISRPFLIAIKAAVSAQAQDFINFILSAEGQAVIGKNGYIQVKDTGAYKNARASGKVTVAGSSSVTPAMEKLKEAYQKLNPNVDVEIQQSDSSTGMNAAIDGICDIGMASRALKDSEIEKGLKGTVIATDGIAVIVNKANGIGNLTKAQVKDIFTGAVTVWQEVN